MIQDPSGKHTLHHTKYHIPHHSTLVKFPGSDRLRITPLFCLISPNDSDKLRFGADRIHSDECGVDRSQTELISSVSSVLSDSERIGAGRSQSESIRGPSESIGEALQISELIGVNKGSIGVKKRSIGADRRGSSDQLRFEVNRKY
jgi:hypothetical protein